MWANEEVLRKYTEDLTINQIRRGMSCVPFYSHTFPPSPTPDHCMLQVCRVVSIPENDTVLIAFEKHPGITYYERSHCSFLRFLPELLQEIEAATNQ